LPKSSLLSFVCRGAIRHASAVMNLHDSAALLTKRELAAKCRVCIRTVDSWINRKLIGYIKVGHSVRFTPSDVEAFIQKHRIGDPVSLGVSH
jgi:excisionase family DNA binding protein